MRYIPLIVTATLLLASCNSVSEKSDSPSLQEARKTYDRVMKIADESSQLAKMKIEELNSKRDSLIAEGDSALANKIQLLNTKLDSLEQSIESFRKQAEEMKAHSSMKVEGEEHEHHHHGGTVNYEDFSDDELLELQKDMEDQMKSIREEIKSTTQQ